MLYRLKTEPVKNGVQSTVVIEEDNKYGGYDYTVQKIWDYQDTLENIQSSEFSVYNNCKEKCKYKLGYRHEKIPAAVFEHGDIFGICKYFPIVSESYELEFTEAFPVGKAHNEVTDDWNVRKNNQMDKGQCKKQYYKPCPAL